MGEITHVHLSVELLHLRPKSLVEACVLGLALRFDSGLTLSNSRLGKELGVDRRTIIRTIGHLLARGWLKNAGDRQHRRLVPTRDLLSLVGSDRQSPERGDRQSRGVVTGGSQTSDTRVTHRRKEKKRERTPCTLNRFIPPTIEQVREYASSRGLPDFDAGRFVEFYAVNGWRDSKGSPVLNWKQKFISVWEPKAKGVTVDQSDPTHEATPEEIKALRATGELP